MKARLIALVGLVLGCSGLVKGDGPAIEYKLFASTDGRYKGLAAGPVKTETTDVKTPGGTRKLTLDSVQLPGGIVFLVTYIDVPDDVAKADPGPRLDRVRDANKGVDGKLISDKATTIGPEKWPARDILIEKRTGFVRNRIVAAGTRLYQVMIEGPKEFVESKDADRYFDSFEVTK
jgi:hypothetical protein